MIIIMKDMFQNIENYLKQIIEGNKLNEEKIFEDSIITNNEYKDKKGIYIFGNKIYIIKHLNFIKV